MGKFIDLTNSKFNRLTAIEYLGKSIWSCRCECGEFTKVDASNLKNNHTQSCGCLQRENTSKANKKHGLQSTRFYQIWRDILGRTLNKNNTAYSSYGGRGITVCKEWIGFEIFKNDMYESYLEHCKQFGEKNTTIDRSDNNKGYSKENCKWATYKQQALNRRSNKKYMVDGKSLTALEISEKYKLTYSAIMHRIKRKWNIKNLIRPMRRKEKGHYVING